MRAKTTLAIAAIVFASAMAATGSYVPHTVVMKPYIIEKPENPENPEEGNQERRIPSRPVQCTIDPEGGVQFVGMDKPDILSFEVYDLSGECVAVFGDEAAFLEYLFAQTGELQIRLITADWAYIGLK